MEKMMFMNLLKNIGLGLVFAIIGGLNMILISEPEEKNRFFDYVKRYYDLKYNTEEPNLPKMPKTGIAVAAC